MSSKKTFDRHSHALHRLSERYDCDLSDLSMRDIKLILKKIKNNKFKKTPNDIVSPKVRQKNCSYYIVRHRGFHLSCVYDNERDEIKTFLPNPNKSLSTIGVEMKKILDKC